MRKLAHNDFVALARSYRMRKEAAIAAPEVIPVFRHQVLRRPASSFLPDPLGYLRRSSTKATASNSTPLPAVRGPLPKGRGPIFPPVRDVEAEMRYIQSQRQAMLLGSRREPGEPAARASELPSPPAPPAPAASSAIPRPVIPSK